MTTYTTFYNEKTRQFDIAEENCLAKDAKPASEYGQVEVSHFKSRGLAEVSIYMNNSRLKNGEIKMIKCKDCKKWFLLTKKSAEFYAEKGLKLPARCKRCRDERKKQAEEGKEISKGSSEPTNNDEKEVI